MGHTFDSDTVGKLARGLPTPGAGPAPILFHPAGLGGPDTRLARAGIIIIGG